MGFMFGRRRREEESRPRPGTAVADRTAHAAPGTDAGPQPRPFDQGLEEEPESSMPRWRRPSLMAARKQVPRTGFAADAAQRLRFGPASGPNADAEIHSIRYRMVRLTDRPDEIMGVEIERLDQGDEIEVLERSGGYVRVRTPLGQEGWVHRTTVGERLAGSPEPHRPRTESIPVPVDLGAVFGDRPQAPHPDGADMSPAARLLQERLGG